MEKEKSLNHPEIEDAKHSLSFSSNLDLESLGENYENINHELASHMLTEVVRSLEKYEDSLSQRARDLLKQARSLKNTHRKKLNQIEDSNEKNYTSMNFYKDQLEKIKSLHLTTRRLFENKEVLEK